MMNNLGIDGLATGFRTTEVVNKLMAIEKQPVKALEKKKNILGQQADAWREMNTRLNALKEAADALQSTEMFRSRTATLTNNDAFAVTSATGAGLNHYDITVKKLSKGHSLTSDAKNSKDVALRMRGTFKIDGQAVEVEPTDSLQKIADKINQTPVNITASIVQVNKGKYKLAIVSKNSGETSKITFKDGGIGRGVLTNLGILNRKDRIKNQIQEASDAVVTVNGVAIQRPSNQIDDAITNVGLDLKKENASSRVTIELDYDKIIAAVRNLVEKYNDVMDYINQNSGRTGSALFSSSTLMNIQNDLRRTLRPQISGLQDDIGLLDLVGIKGSAGIDGAKSGHLELDENLLRKKLDKNIDGIAKLFGATDENGVFKKMYDVLFDITGTGGLIGNQIKASGRQVTDLNKQIATAEERLEAKKQNYYRKFNAMEQALASLQNQGKWMAAQLSTINNNNNNYFNNNNKNKTNEGA
jgi:flagellar hook-associated protein 2